jgi:DNA-binding IclR family transcriptional regulator
MRNPGRYRIAALERALSIVDLLADRPELTIAEIAEAISAPRPSVLRHLAVLMAAGYVSSDESSRRYSLGPHLMTLGHAARRQLRLTDVAEATMQALRDRYDETVNLGVLDRGEVVHVAVEPSRHPVHMAAQVGERTFVHISGLGKVLLAFAPPEVVREIVGARPLTRFTSHTLTSKRALAAELALVRERGYAIDDEESALGLRCVAAPVRDARGEVVSAVSLSCPADRLSLDAAHAAARDVQAAGNDISVSLGWPASSPPEHAAGGAG